MIALTFAALVERSSGCSLIVSAATELRLETSSWFLWSGFAFAWRLFLGNNRFKSVWRTAPQFGLFCVFGSDVR